MKNSMTKHTVALLLLSTIFSLPTIQGFTTTIITSATKTVNLRSPRTFLPSNKNHSPHRSCENVDASSSLLPRLTRRQRWTSKETIIAPRGLSSKVESDDDDSVNNDEDENEKMGEEEKPVPTKVDNILKDIHALNRPFRIVVIGNGAILETTSILGPHMATSQSPKTGERLVTLASEDKSFEFHLKVDRVAKVTFTETDRPATATANKKTLRIVRFVGEGDEPICSLILADSSTEATEWFKDMTIRYGYA